MYIYDLLRFFSLLLPPSFLLPSSFFLPSYSLFPLPSSSYSLFLLPSSYTALRARPMDKPNNIGMLLQHRIQFSWPDGHHSENIIPWV